MDAATVHKGRSEVQCVVCWYASCMGEDTEGQGGSAARRTETWMRRPCTRVGVKQGVLFTIVPAELGKAPRAWGKVLPAGLGRGCGDRAQVWVRSGIMG